ncbi:hypothetical protein QQ056_16195 [Oscillatoria laete-virens NRMC-F 0139]|nr:hypothetical protein [Oscillatoria laete-virens]MDL5055080.1 hypothetical protein [Oscillatoria laete-virens NRMC-F 0139]
MITKIVPTISSGTAGPLGILHLPRLWQKCILFTKGLLPDDYGCCSPGYDMMVLDALGISKDDVLAFFKDKQPNYAAFEAWVLEKKGGNLDQAAIKKLNEAIIGYNHKDDVRVSILESACMKDDGRFKDAVNLNNFDDWAAFHALVVKA